MYVRCAVLLCMLGLPGVICAQDKAGLVTKETQSAIDAGLKFLEKEQANDGSFGTGQYQGNVAITSLAGLAFLSAEPGRANRDKIVANAVRYVLSQESKTPIGFLNSKKATHGPMYSHGFAVLFLADAHEKLEDKKLQADVKETLERAVQLVIKTQNREGGWRYMPNIADADISVTTCQVMGLRAARDVGIGVPRSTLDRAADYIKRCQHKDGGFKYQTGVEEAPPGFARSAAGLAALNRLGVTDRDAIDKGIAYLKKFEKKAAPDPAPPGGDAGLSLHYSYGNYYAAKEMWYMGDKEWQKWYPGIRAELLQNKKEDHWKHGAMCPHYDTAVALIILQMPDARLPSLKR
jgi:prenyltransferase beta subunit